MKALVSISALLRLFNVPHLILPDHLLAKAAVLSRQDRINDKKLQQIYSNETIALRKQKLNEKKRNYDMRPRQPLQGSRKRVWVAR